MVIPIINFGAPSTTAELGSGSLEFGLSDIKTTSNKIENSPINSSF